MHETGHARPAPATAADPAPDVAPPRRPGARKPRDVIVQHHVRVALGLFVASLITMTVAALLIAGDRESAQGWTFAGFLLVLGLAALVHAARVGLRKRS